MAAKYVFRPALLHKAMLFCFALVLLCPASLFASDHLKYEATRHDARDFVAGGSLHLRMTVGDLHIKRGDSTKIKLEYTVKSSHEKNVQQSRVDFDVHGNTASIEFHAPSSNTQFEVDLEVPENTNLDIHEKVGDLTVENIQGDKDLNLGVGDIRIANGHSEYRLVNASAGIGDVNSDSYGETHGWLGKSLKYHGEGKYELRAHVGVGDITMERK